MPGFFVGNIKSNILSNATVGVNYIYKDYEIDGLFFSRNTTDKFINDKCFSISKKYIIIVEGVLLNKSELLETYECSNICDLCMALYEKKGNTFFCYFNGVFSGCLYDIDRKTLIVYTNQTGSKQVFYYRSHDHFMFGSDINNLIDASMENNIKLSFNEVCAYQMLTYGFMIDNSTYAKEIHRLQAGQYALVERGDVCIKTYHYFKKNLSRFKHASEKKMIEELDLCFKNAVKLVYQKNEEYGYDHFAEISGGLDSRMGIWVAHSQKNRHVQLVEYGKADYLDEVIAKEIAKYWKDEIIIKPLDDLSFFYDIDKVCKMLGGLSLYVGSTGQTRLVECINMRKYGLEVTGDLGDVIIGSYAYKKGNEIVYPSGAYSTFLLNRINNLSDDVMKKHYDRELFLIYSRGFQGVLNTWQISQRFTEVVSPFCDVDFLQLCMDIPVEKRVGHSIYKKWILWKYPEAAKFKWEKIDDYITESSLKIKLWRMRRRLENILKVGKGNPAFSMNPFDVWYRNTPELRLFFDNYMVDSFEFIKTLASDQFLEDINMLYSSGNVAEKTMVLTVLSSVKQYFHNK